MNVGSSVGGGGVSGYQYRHVNAAEVQVTIAGGLAEVDRGGPAFNMIPKTGGNTFAGSYFGSFAGQWAQGSNIDDTLRSYGFTDLPALIRNWDTNFAFSGPDDAAIACGSSSTRARSARIRTRQICTATRTPARRTSGRTRRTRT